MERRVRTPNGFPGQQVDISFVSPMRSRELLIDLQNFKAVVRTLIWKCSYTPVSYVSNLQLQGSEDGKVWHVLAGFGSGQPLSTIEVPVSDKAFRYFKVKQTKTIQVVCSGLELYGDLYIQ
jgi:hypothetical protein